MGTWTSAGSDDWGGAGREALEPWEYTPTVLDTFFAVTERVEVPEPDPVVAKQAVGYGVPSDPANNPQFAPIRGRFAVIR